MKNVNVNVNTTEKPTAARPCRVGCVCGQAHLYLPVYVYDDNRCLFPAISYACNTYHAVLCIGSGGPINWTPGYMRKR